MCYAEEVPERGRNEVGNLKRQIELSGFQLSGSGEAGQEIKFSEIF